MDSSSTDLTSSSEEELFELARRRRQPKTFKIRKTYFYELSDEEFFHRFRFTKRTVEIILSRIKNQIKFNSLRNRCLSPMQQLLLTLRFFASGCMLISAGDFAGVTKATAGRIIRKVATAIAQLSQEYIKMPEGIDEITKVQGGFYKISKFPKVIGTIDCTHIKIQSPGKKFASPTLLMFIQ